MDMSLPLIIKTHEAQDIYKLLYPTKKCIYVYRDGRDLLLSYYFYTKMFSSPTDVIIEPIGKRHDLASRTTKPIEFDRSELSDFLQAHSFEWASHVTSWLKDKEIYGVRYEALHNGFTEMLNDIANYLAIQPVVSFDSVQQEYVNEFRKYFLNNNQQFFRKGIIGDWHNYYTKHHIAIITEIAGDILKGVGYQ